MDMNGLLFMVVVEMMIINMNRVFFFVNLFFILNVVENILFGIVVYDVIVWDDDIIDVLIYIVVFVFIIVFVLL